MVVRLGILRLALICMAVVTASAPAVASETYVCADNTTVVVTAQNRAEMSEHPCVKAWFEKSQRKAQAKIPANPDNPSRVAVMPWRSNAASDSYDDAGHVLSLSIYTGRPKRLNWYGDCPLC